LRSLSIEARLLAAFAGGLATLALCAWFALGSASACLDATRRSEQFGDAAYAMAMLRGALAGSAADVSADNRPAARRPSRRQVASALAGAEAALGEEPDGAAKLHARTAALLARLDALAQPTATAALLARDASLGMEVRALEEWLLDQQARARATAAVHGERERNLVALLAVLVIMALCGACAFVIGSVRERRRLLARLRQSVNHDALTGLPNRRFFGEWLGYAIAHARREVRHVGLLFIDIEGVKAVEELHGSGDADALLIEISRRFRETAREGDLLARIGPYEFALAIPDVTDPREAAPLAQRLRDALADPARPPLADTPIGASVGVAFYPDDADDPAGVIAAADAAMYAAKGAGRNRVAFPPLAHAA
jgi:diguanylate cyclase (GGDEF)-like protein